MSDGQIVLIVDNRLDEMRKGNRRVKFELQMAGEDKYDEEDPEVFDDVDDEEEEEGKVVELLEVELKHKFWQMIFYILTHGMCTLETYI